MKSETGFTLIEVLVSITLLTIGLFGLLSMLTTAMSGNRFSYEGTTGVKSAEYMMDLIRVNGGNDNGRYDGMNTDATATCEGNIDYNADCGPWRAVLLNSSLVNPRGTVTVLTDTPTLRTDTVEVQIEWGEAGMPRRRTILRTILETWRS